MSVAADLPTDVAVLQALLRAMTAERDRVAAERDQAIAEHAQDKAERARLQAELQRLYLVIKELQRHRFGRRSEKSAPDQLSLALEATEQQIAAAQSALEAAEARRTGQPRERRPRRLNLGALPVDLPRIERVVDVGDKTCRCCGGALHLIGEDVSERLDMVPASFRVEVVRRPKYACRACEQGVVQAPAPARVVEGGLPTESLVAQVVVSKYADHLPLYRQAQIFARQGIGLDRSTLADWVGRAAFELAPLWQRLREIIAASPVVFADETRAPVLDPGRGTTKKGQFWSYARDERPWGGDSPPAVAYVYEPDRSKERPAAHLAGFRGTLQVDGYPGYAGLAGQGVALAFCWSHVRRKFWDIKVAGNAPIAEEAVQRINQLFMLERHIAGCPPAERQYERLLHAAPMVAELKAWLEDRRKAVPRSSGIANAIGYALERWDGLTRFLEDGRVELSTNTVERAIRPLALGRKNHLFAGSDGGAEHWAIAASLLETCKLNDVDPQAWLGWVLARLVDGHPQSRIDELLPWAFAGPPS